MLDGVRIVSGIQLIIDGRAADAPGAVFIGKGQLIADIPGTLEISGTVLCIVAEDDLGCHRVIALLHDAENLAVAEAACFVFREPEILKRDVALIPELACIGNFADGRDGSILGRIGS